MRPGALESDLFSDTSSATGESVISRRTTDSQVSSASKMSGYVPCFSLLEKGSCSLMTHVQRFVLQEICQEQAQS